MTRRRITLKIDRVSTATPLVSRQALTAAIEAQLGTLLQSGSSADLAPQANAIAVLDGGRIARNSSALGLETGIGQAIAQATMGVLKP